MNANLKIKRFIFFNGNVKWENNELSWKTGILNHQKYISTDKLVGILPLKKWYWLNYKIQVVTSNVQNKEISFKVSKNMLSKFLQFFKSIDSPVYTELKRCITKETDENIDFLSPNSPTILKDNSSIWDYGESLYLVGKGERTGIIFWVPFYYEEFTEEKIKEILFFNRSGNDIYFGGKNDQFRVKGLSPQMIDYINQRFIEMGAKFGTVEGTEFKNTFSLWNWILNIINLGSNERIIVSDEALQFNTKKRKKEDNIYLPIDEVMFHRIEKGLFGDKIEIYGTQNIQTKLKFSKKASKAIKSKLEAATKNEVKHVARKYMFYSFLGGIIKKQKHGSISVLDNSLMISLPKKERKKGDAIFFRVEYNDVMGYYFKKPWLFSMKRNGILIFHDSNIRVDQASEGRYFYMKKFNGIKTVIESLGNNGVNPTEYYTKKELKKLYKSEFGNK